MSLIHFSATELTELEALEIMGGATANPLSQGACTNEAEFCGGGVAQETCSNKSKLCGVLPPPQTLNSGCGCSSNESNCLCSFRDCAG